MKLEFFIFTFLIYFFQLVKTDIPVHCLKSQVIYIITHQIVGRWKFFLTVPAKKTVPEQYQLTCGHSNPSHESSAYKFNMNQNDFISTIEMELKDSDEALLNDNNEQIVINI